MKDPFDDLFKFPILQIDGNYEERKQTKSVEGEIPEPDLILSVAELPYWDFIGIKDGWAPLDSGFELAVAGKFECCTPIFRECGSYIVPWSRAKFKEEFQNFLKTLPEESITSLPFTITKINE